MKKETILIIAAHPDDEILGCGGTIGKLVNDGCDVYTFILGEGITSRYEKREKEKMKDEIKELKNHIKEANKILGVKKVFTLNFPDNRFDSVPLLDIIKEIEIIKNQIKPDIIFTHCKGDLNIDHRKTYEAVLTATRPIKNETVKTIYSFEVLSSTEWNYPTIFSPNVFFNITESFEKKIDAMKCYKNELRKKIHPRSLEIIESNAKTWGSKVGVKYSEPFELIRTIKL